MKKITVVAGKGKGQKYLQEYFHQLLNKYDGLCLDDETDTQTLAEALAHRVSEDLIMGID